ncbi:metal ABC transporter permease [Marinomonas algarum]|uniref:Metal ABC transporter permease n=1 Tax=Marinomonas algarum TaxID=2883105 RepID=A0A9X1IQP1_9GAMM|nr:metal ABC transporter permease [Marinomonas algarum]MCB5162756.1 metal ABC transporter permease [Marinomonas algarum]
MDQIVTVLFEPFKFEFMKQAFIMVVLIAIPTAVLSCFLVLKGWSLMGDAISHSVLPGVVLAHILALPYSVGAFVAGLFCALFTGFLKENSRVKEDTLMGVVFSGMFGLGLVLMVKVQAAVHLDHILFGNVLGIDWRDIQESAVIAIVVVVFMALKGKDLLLFIFDRQHAKAIGLPVSFLHYGLLIILSLTIVGALKAVGMILVVAMLIAPGAIAFLLTRSFIKMLALSVCIGTSCAVLGMYVSFIIDSAPAPTIVLLMTLTFITIFTHNRFKCRVKASSIDREAGSSEALF